MLDEILAGVLAEAQVEIRILMKLRMITNLELSLLLQGILIRAVNRVKLGVVQEARVEAILLHVMYRLSIVK